MLVCVCVCGLCACVCVVCMCVWDGCGVVCRNIFQLYHVHGGLLGCPHRRCPQLSSPDGGYS